MQAVILAAETTPRLTDEPASLFPIGGQPLLWHLIRHYAAYGIDQFVIACGSRHEVKQSMCRYFLTMNPQAHAQPSHIVLIATEEDATPTEQLRGLREHLGQGAFCLSAGNHLSSVNIHDLIRHHQRQGNLVTKAVARSPEGPDGRHTPAAGEESWAASGPYVVEPAALDALASEAARRDQEPFDALAPGQRSEYRHTGFSQSVNTPQDKDALEIWWNSGNAPWKTWLS
jgi:glucose-1-phosphate cytidylyltransferase